MNMKINSKPVALIHQSRLHPIDQKSKLNKKAQSSSGRNPRGAKPGHAGQCQHCKEVSRARLPEGTPQGIIGPNLLSYTAALAGQYHLSVRMIQSLLKEQLGITFSIGTISEAQTKVASMITPLHLAVRDGIQKSPMVHIDETPHPINDEYSVVVVSDQCPSYNWIPLDRRQLCWSHIK